MKGETRVGGEVGWSLTVFRCLKRTADLEARDAQFCEVTIKSGAVEVSNGEELTVVSGSGVAKRSRWGGSALWLECIHCWWTHTWWWRTMVHHCGALWLAAKKIVPGKASRQSPTAYEDRLERETERGRFWIMMWRVHGKRVG
jgi:hypothetical protein